MEHDETLRTWICDCSMFGSFVSTKFSPKLLGGLMVMNPMGKIRKELSEKQIQENGPTFCRWFFFLFITCDF